MKKIAILLLFLVILPYCSGAQTTEEKRRIDEEKRQSLRFSAPSSGQRPQADYPLRSPVNLDYFSELISRETAFNSDACRALVVLMGLQQQYKDFQSQVVFLERNNIIPKRLGADFSPDQPLCKGMVAYMFARALNIKGGLWIRLFGLSQRYAVKELVFEGIMISGNMKELISGKELVLILVQAAEYMADQQQAARAQNRQERNCREKIE